MIQRLQSLYLAVAALLVAALFFLPIGNYLLPDKSVISLHHDGITEHGALNIASSLVTIMLSITIVYTLISIFLFSNRRLQMKICLGGIVIDVLLCCTILYVFFTLGSEIPGSKSMIRLTQMFPLMAAVLQYMAYVAIQKDEDLVQSADRIR